MGSGNGKWTGGIAGYLGSGKDWYANNEIDQSDLGDKSRYSGFDFDKIWQIADGRARLRSCPWQTITSY